MGPPTGILKRTSEAAEHIHECFLQWAAQFPSFPADVKHVVEMHRMWVCVEPDTDKDAAFLALLEVALIYLFDDCFEQIVQQPELDDLCDLFISTPRDVAVGNISEWDSSTFVTKGTSAALAVDMSVRLAIIKGILAIDEQLLSSKLFAVRKCIHYETLVKFHEEDACWKRLRGG
ncbi:hypothetical protein BGZ93_000839 [Podila epicladia]|nr:hypothetical protein BGZ93_000839 [Podila epicladia]